MKKLLWLGLLGLSFGLQAQNMAVYVNGTEMENGATLVLTYATDADETLHAYSIFENIGDEAITIKGVKALNVPESLVGNDAWCIMGACQGAEAQSAWSLDPGERFAGTSEYFGIMPEGYVGDDVEITYTFTAFTTGDNPEERGSITFTLKWELLEQPTDRMKIYLAEGRDQKLVEDGHLYEYAFELDGDPDQELHIYTSFENPGAETVIIYGQKQAAIDPMAEVGWCMLGNCWGESDVKADAYPLLPGATITSDPQGDQHYIDYTPNGYVGTGYVYYTFYDKENPANRVNFAVAWKTTEFTANERMADAVQTVVYPNPAVTTARLTWEAVEGAVVLNVRSVSGQLLYSRPVEGLTETEINVAGFTPGMYFYTLERQGERLASGKLLVR